jgi:hypothetical protein
MSKDLGSVHPIDVKFAHDWLPSFAQGSHRPQSVRSVGTPYWLT